ncbi:hypothetical protein [[Muricauda] lutisoli]|uniref:Uncharacterized protein n=1 Tax=[Muricauda] lutisoli TaxID=2816035 RepID=A0ABS3EYE9_9FLAO|nr:hypothetical protein [[Muricauda] lutisoli]MBO0331195.1 hypothetical protein [[Muricauda] lutisoli]
MRLKVHITVWFTLALAAMALGQEKDVPFYEKQAWKDAHQEQSTTFSSLEDEKDFWKDQNRYEKDLKTKDDLAYNSYMVAKRAAYSEHAKTCGNHCAHSYYYYERASIYFSFEINENFSREAIGTLVQVASPRIF